MTKRWVPSTFINVQALKRCAADSRIGSARRLPFLALAALLCLGTQSAAADGSNGTVTPGYDIGPGWQLVFADEFNGTALDTTLWTYRTGSRGGTVTLEFPSVQLARTVAIENATGADGRAMVISPEKLPEPIETTHGPKDYAGGGIISTQSFGYGYFETRAKLPSCSGWHSAFWAFSPDGSTELDGFEHDAHNHTHMSHNVHQHPQGYHSPSTSHQEPWDPAAGWHTYGFEWNSQGMKVYLDGRRHSWWNSSTGQYQSILPLPESLGLSDVRIWLSSIAMLYGSVTMDDTCLQQGPDGADQPGSKVYFDYVRFYEKHDELVDNDIDFGEGYTEPSGSWTTSGSNVLGYAGSAARFSSSAGATARWTPRLPVAADYTVCFYRVTWPTADTAAQISVRHDAGTSTSVMDLTAGPAGWVRLGRWHFTPGQAYVQAVRGNSYLRTDAVFFVRDDTC